MEREEKWRKTGDPISSILASQMYVDNSTHSPQKVKPSDQKNLTVIKVTTMEFVVSLLLIVDSVCPIFSNFFFEFLLKK